MYIFILVSSIHCKYSPDIQNNNYNSQGPQLVFIDICNALQLRSMQRRCSVRCNYAPCSADAAYAAITLPAAQMQRTLHAALFKYLQRAAVTLHG